VTVFPITHGDRSGWQRRVAGELVRVLDAHSDLPLIVWTVGSAGSVLVGHVDGLGPATLVRGRFHAWRQALGMQERPPTTSADGALTHLWASNRRGPVRVCLTGTVIEDEVLA
jgi:predicted PhzF superfamily epimerase YddE/YHI9